MEGGIASELALFHRAPETSPSPGASGLTNDNDSLDPGVAPIYCVLLRRKSSQLLASLLDTRIEFERAAKIVTGTYAVAQALPGDTAIEIGKCKRRIEIEGQRECLCRQGRLAAIEVGIAHIIRNEWIAGVELERPFVIGERLVILRSTRMNIGTIEKGCSQIPGLVRM